MQMSGEETIQAPRTVVWKALNDPAILKQCIPGCESITRHSDRKMEAKVIAKVGPVKAGFTGVVTLSELDPPNGYRISGEGKGGLAGFATGGATVKLSDAPGGTLLAYDVDAQVGGKLAMLGSRLIDSTARSMASQFFEKFARIVSGMKEEGAAPKAVRKKPAARKPAKKAAKKSARKTTAGKSAKKAGRNPAKKKI